MEKHGSPSPYLSLRAGYEQCQQKLGDLGVPFWTNLIQMASVVERDISNKQLSKMDKRNRSHTHAHTHSKTLQGEHDALLNLP